MLKKLILVCSIVLAMVSMPVMAKDGSKGSHGSKGSCSSKRSKGSDDKGSKGYCDKSSKGSHGSKGAKGSKGSQGSNDDQCKTYTKKAEKAHKKYVYFNEKYTECQANIGTHTAHRKKKGSTCKAKKHGSKGSKGSHGSSNKQCKKYKKEVDESYAKYLGYLAKKGAECANPIPVAFDQNITTPEDTALAILLSGNDSNGAALIYTVLAQPSSGILSGTDANLTYTPNSNYHGTDSFIFKVNDGTSDSEPATVYITITPVNDAPLAQEQNLTTPEDTNLSIILTGSDEENDTLTYTVTTQPSHGTLNGTAPNIVYTPNTNYYGTDSFAFKVNDGTVDSLEATVNIIVTPINDAPVAKDDNTSTNEDTNITIDVLANDSDVDGTLDSATLSVSTNPTNGTVTIIDGNISYLPHANYHGTDSFTYTIKDNEGLVSNQTTVNIIINEINDAPLAHGQSLTLAEDTTIDIILSGTDNDGDVLVYNVMTQPTHGTLSGTVPNVTYIPQANYHGSDSFTFTVNDGNLTSNEATVDITVTPVNDAPVANDDNTSTNEDTTVVIDILSNDNDLDGTLETASIVIEANASQGSVAIESGKVRYTPNADYFGADSFTYSVKDNEGLVSNVATVVIAVHSVNDAPLAQEQNLTTPEDTNLSITLTGSDEDDDTLTYNITTQPSHGTLSGTVPNIVYTPNTNYNGTDSFAFKVNDGTVDSSEATVNIIVTPVNDAPVARDKDFIIPEDTNVSMILKGIDSDSDTLTYHLRSQPTHGKVSGDSQNLTYIPTLGFYGLDSFTYVVNDGTVDSLEATITIEVTRDNVAPLAIGQSLTTDEDTPLLVKLHGVDSDNDILSYSIVSQPSHGVLSGTGANITYTPNQNYSGNDSFTFSVNDGLLDSNEANVNIVVTPAPELGCKDTGSTPIGEFNTVVKWHWKSSNSQSLPSWENPYSSPIVVPLEDTNNDLKIDSSDIPAVIFHTHRQNNALGGSVMRAISGLDGRELWTLESPILKYSTDIAAGDIDGDGLVEIIAQTNDSKLLILYNNGKVKFIGTENIEPINSSFSINDIDNDGNPEIIYGNSVFDNKGNLLWKGTGYKGLNNYSSHATSIVADINLDGYSEIIAGPTAYDSNGTILWNTNIGDGYTALGNFNNDKYPEIVLVTKGKVYLLEYDGTIIWGPITLPGGGGNGGGGAPTVADMDGDGEPEIGIAGANYYVVFETDGSIKWQSKTKDYSSAITGSSVFDFDNDGKVEIVYADEDYLRIYNGENGEILYQLENSSGTAKEIPIIVDADKDGSADIIFISNDYSTRTSNGIKMISDLNNTWAPTRSIWNQHSYHINNINDDGTIPQYEEPSWLTHNTYRLNTFAVDTKCQKPPKAYAEVYKTLENTVKSIALLAKDINNDTLTYRITQQPQHGTLTGSAPFLTYIPNGDYVGDDSFSYVANDGIVDSNEANITINILSLDNALIAVDDNVSLEEDGNITVDVLANDSNATTSVSIAIIVPPDHGNASIVDGKIYYQPNENYNGEDVLYYTYRNSNEFVSNSAKVTFNIGESNDAPVSYEQNLTFNEDSVKIITLQAVDADNDKLEYSIVSQPEHGTLNGVPPYISYTPSKDYTGSDNFSFKTFDGNLDSNIANIIVNILPVNDAPVAIAGNNQKKIIGQEVILNGQYSYDVDGNITSYEWKEGNNTLSTEATFSKSDFTLGLHTLTLIATDNTGLSASSTTTVEILPANTPDTVAPIITILGNNPYLLNIGDSYTDAGATAWDDRDGNISVGVSYNFNTAVEGTYQVTYSAIDSSGNQATAIRTVMVIDNSTPDTTPPVITLLGENPFIVYEGTVFNDPGVSVIDDHDGKIGYSINHNVNINQIGKYLVTYNAVDQAGNSAEANRTVLVRSPDGNQAPIADAGLDVSIDLGEEILFDASNSRDIDGDIVSYEWKEDNRTLSTGITFSKSDFTLGKHVLTLYVTDNEGAISSDTIVVHVTDPSDVTAPIASITSPIENTVVTLKIDITGTASDANLDYYTLALSPVGKNTYTEFARGTSSVTEDVLGTLDVTTLKNGIYDIRLRATDANGLVSEAYTKIIIEGKAKIGNFSFTVTDFDLQVGGIPVQVNRTYSTLQRFEKLDFTYAWSIDYQNVKVEENRNPGKEWKVTPDVLVGSCFKFDKQHIVNISLPDGTTESFEFKFARECGHYFTGSFYDAPKLYALNGSEAKLETIDASDSVMMNNSGEIIDSASLALYNPSQYRLTLPNGMVYDVSENFGIKKVKDIRGDTLTYNNNGIVSSRGESLTFERDAQNRITKITDLAGKSMTYHYNQNDDLDYVIDQLGQKTEYRYQAGHLLEEYFDPSGLRLTKNIYDESGRLIQTIDADGNVVEFTHDLDGKEEIIKDKLGRISLFVYDEEGNVLSQTNPEGETTTYTYDEDGNQLSVTDPLGNTITNTYDANNNLLETVDALGNSEVTTYNTKQSPTAISDKNGNTMSIVYNAYNNPKSMTTANGATTTYYYDQYGNKVSATNEYNQTTTYVYDEKFITLLGGVSSKGNLLKETRPDGTVVEHTYDESSNLLTTTTTLADGSVTTTSNIYDAFNRMISTTDALGQTTTYTYDARGNKISTTDSQGRTTNYTYNNHNKPTLTTYPDGTTESKTYDAMDNLLSETNQEGETTSYAYDGADRLIKTTHPDGAFTTTAYDEAGRTTSTTDENGNTTTYEYDAVGNRISTTDALGNKTTFTYDAQGNMLSMTDALGQTTSYAYNALNQRIETTYPDNTTVKEAKNISGLPSSKTDEAGQRTSYGYDTSRTIPLLNQVTLSNNAVTHYGYDSEGKKTSQTDALGRSTNWSYKTTGELKTETLPLGQSKTFTYDTQGKQTQIKDYANKTQKFIYDAYDKLVRIEYADGSTITYDYTPSGRLKSQTDAQGTITNTYDARGRLKSQTNPNNETITYTYDSVGNIVEIQTPQTTITKTYDALNRLESVTDEKGTVTYTYDAIGRQTKVTYSNGMTTSYEYDTRNRVTNITHKKSDGTVLQSFAYTLDSVGNRTQIVENTGRTTDYEYNTVHQLTKETITNDPSGNNTTTTFTYDDVGNLLTKTIDGASTDYTYNDNDQLTTQGSVTFTYDANGNLIAKDNTTYEYDDKNRLVKTTTPTDTIEYSYDANDNRVAKTTTAGTTTYLIDANTAYAHVITETKDNGTSIEYTYGNDLLSDGTHTFLTDALGSTRGLVDDSGVLTDSYSYTPYGTLTEHSGTSENSFLYTGEQFDSETEDYYLRARYYSPNSGRFLSRDSYDGTANSPISQNHYLYAGANPNMYVDPSGHMSLAEVSMSIGIRAQMFAMNFPRLAMSFEAVGSAMLPMELSMSTPYAWVGFSGAAAIGAAPEMHKMAATALSLKRTKYWLERFRIGREWEELALSSLKLTKYRRAITSPSGRRAFPDAIRGTTIVEIKSRTFMRAQAQAYADFISSGGKLKDGGAVSDATYMFLIKPLPTEEDALRRIFSEKNVPLEINYVFDF